jgi:drug/metabolite transporter (DMT)-like permease
MNTARTARYGPLALAVVCVSTGSILVRLAQAPPLAVAFYRVFLASLLLAPFAAAAVFRHLPSLRRRERVVLVTAGLALALHFATWIASLSYTSVAASVLLVNMAPIFTLLLSWLFLGEVVSPMVLAALALALGGATVIAAGDWSRGPDPLKGDLLALAGAVTLSIYHVVGRGLRAALPLAPYVLGVWSVSALTLGLLAVSASVPLVGYSARTMLVLFALALVPTLFGHGLVNRSLRVLPAPVVGLFLLGEPVGASILAYALFNEIPSQWTLTGGALVLAALVLVVLPGTR